MIRGSMVWLRDALREDQPPRWDRRDTAICLLLLAAFLGSRGPWILAHPMSSSYWEEAYRWVAIEELAGGAARSFLDYQADHYQGGSLVVIGLGVLLRLVGLDALAALKLVALFFSGTTLAALYVLGRLFFGRLVGLLCGLVYLAGPPLVAFWGVVAMGFHAESALFSLAGFGAFLALATGSWHGARAWFSLGLVLGLAIWFTPTAGMTLVACILTWPLLAGRPSGSALGAAAAGLSLGLAPWLVYNAVHDFAGIDRVLEVFGAQSSADPWRSQGLGERTRDLLLRVPTQGLLDPGGDSPGVWRSRALSAGVWVPGGVALAAASGRALGVLRGGRAHGDVGARRELVFLVYLAVFAAAYLASRFTLDLEPSPIAYRLMVPAAIAMIPPIAISGARGLRAGGVARRLSAIACSVGLASLCAATVGFALRHEEPGTPLSLEQGYMVWGRLVHRKHAPDVEAAVAAATRAAAGLDRERMLRGIGWAMEDAYEQRGSLADLERSLAVISQDERAAVVRGLRWALTTRHRDLVETLERREDVDLRRKLTRVDALADWVDGSARAREPGDPW
jgi:hypothetical protein